METLAVDDGFIRTGRQSATDGFDTITMNPEIGLKHLAFIDKSSAFEEIC
jgi:hypothetical protein